MLASVLALGRPVGGHGHRRDRHPHAFMGGHRRAVGGEGRRR